MSYFVQSPGFGQGAPEDLGDYLDVTVQAHYQHGALGSCCDSCASGGPCGGTPTYPVRRSAFTGLRSVRHSGMEQTLGAIALSDNEKILLKLGAVGLAAWFAWKAMK